MLTDHIIGRVGADILAKRLATPAQAGDSVALFRLDKLSASQVAAVARSVMGKPDLIARMDLMIPEALVEGQGLPQEILIQHNAGYVRNNVETEKEAILTASGSEHNLSDTLAHVTPIGAKEMRANPQPWVDATLHTGGLSPVADDRAVFQAAIGGLLASSELSLVQLGEFCSEIVEAISTRGLPIRDAVGYALPRAGLPRDSGYFSNARTFGTTRSPWQKAFAKLFAQRAPLLKKLRQNGQPLDPEELIERIEANAAEIAEGARLAAPEENQVTFAHVLKYWNWSADEVVSLVESVKQQTMYPEARLDGAVGISRWIFHREKLRAWHQQLDSGRANWVTIPEVAKILGIKQQVAYWLTQNSYIRAEKLGTIRDVGSRVKKLEVERFLREYIFATEIADRVGRSSRKVMRMLKELSIYPLRGDSSAEPCRQLVYRRSDALDRFIQKHGIELPGDYEQRKKKARKRVG